MFRHSGNLFTCIALLCCFALGASPALANTYNLVIARQAVHVTAEPVNAITINGTIPGPTLRFREGEDVTVNVTNRLDEPTSLHWHGMLIPAAMDGAPGFNGFPGIMPGVTFSYHFHVRQSGTYWYHSHSGGQEQEGLYGSIVIAPKGKDPVRADREYVVLLSDFTKESPDTILNNLKMDSAYYNYAQRTVGDFLHDVRQKGFASAWQNASLWGRMRMSPADLSDVSGYTFLMNGKTPERNWTGLFKKGEKIRLRFINGSAMSIYDLRIPGLTMTVVAADGQNVEPVPVDELRFGIAETYDVIVEPKEEKAYTIVAEPIDRTGFALGTLAPQEDMRGKAPQHRPRALLTMGDMGGMQDMESMMKDLPDMDMRSGWENTGAPEGNRVLRSADLRALGIDRDARPPSRTIAVTLNGNMQRYIWTMDGHAMNTAPIRLRYGERVRLKLVNETMMAHPMHLHGMFVQLENGQPMDKLPRKHTVIVPPGQTVSLLLTADEPGEWPFHCHMLYHMMAGMMTYADVGQPGEAIQAGVHRHAH